LSCNTSRLLAVRRVICSVCKSLFIDIAHMVVIWTMMSLKTTICDSHVNTLFLIVCHCVICSVRMVLHRVSHFICQIRFFFFFVSFRPHVSFLSLFSGISSILSFIHLYIRSFCPYVPFIRLYIWSFCPYGYVPFIRLYTPSFRPYVPFIRLYIRSFCPFHDILFTKTLGDFLEDFFFRIFRVHRNQFSTFSVMLNKRFFASFKVRDSVLDRSF